MASLEDRSPTVDGRTVDVKQALTREAAPPPVVPRAAARAPRQPRQPKAPLFQPHGYAGSHAPYGMHMAGAQATGSWVQTPHGLAFLPSAQPAPAFSGGMPGYGSAAAMYGAPAGRDTSGFPDSAFGHDFGAHAGGTVPPAAGYGYGHGAGYGFPPAETGDGREHYGRHAEGAGPSWPQAQDFDPHGASPALGGWSGHGPAHGSAYPPHGAHAPRPGVGHEPAPHEDASVVTVLGVPPSADDGTLERHFAAFGPVRWATVPAPGAAGYDDAAGFVCFASGAIAARAASVPRQLLEGVEVGVFLAAPVPSAMHKQAQPWEAAGQGSGYGIHPISGHQQASYAPPPGGTGGGYPGLAAHTAEHSRAAQPQAVWMVDGRVIGPVEGAPEPRPGVVGMPASGPAYAGSSSAMVTPLASPVGGRRDARPRAATAPALPIEEFDALRISGPSADGRAAVAWADRSSGGDGRALEAGGRTDGGRGDGGPRPRVRRDAGLTPGSHRGDDAGDHDAFEGSGSLLGLGLPSQPHGGGAGGPAFVPQPFRSESGPTASRAPPPLNAYRSGSTARTAPSRFQGDPREPPIGGVASSCPTESPRPAQPPPMRTSASATVAVGPGAQRSFAAPLRSSFSAGASGIGRAMFDDDDDDGDDQGDQHDADDEDGAGGGALGLRYSGPAAARSPAAGRAAPGGVALARRRTSASGAPQLVSSDTAGGKSSSSSSHSRNTAPAASFSGAFRGRGLDAGTADPGRSPLSRPPDAADLELLASAARSVQAGSHLGRPPTPSRPGRQAGGAPHSPSGSPQSPMPMIGSSLRPQRDDSAAPPRGRGESESSHISLELLDVLNNPYEAEGAVGEGSHAAAEANAAGDGLPSDAGLSPAPHRAAAMDTSRHDSLSGLILDAGDGRARSVSATKAPARRGSGTAPPEPPGLGVAASVGADPSSQRGPGSLSVSSGDGSAERRLAHITGLRAEPSVSAPRGPWSRGPPKSSIV